MMNKENKGGKTIRGIREGQDNNLREQRTDEARSKGANETSLTE